MRSSTTRFGSKDEELKELEKEMRVEKAKEEEFERKVRKLRKERNKLRLISEKNQPAKNRLKVDENNEFVSIRENWGAPKVTASKKHQQREYNEHRNGNKRRRLEEKLTNIKQIENAVFEGETITDFELEEIDWEKHIAEHKSRLERETKERLERLEKKEIKEKSWELYKLCKNFLEENDSDWQKRKHERELEIKKIERLNTARHKQEKLKMKVHQRKLEEEVQRKLYQLPETRRIQLEQEEEKQRKLEIIENKKSLWKLRNKEKKHCIKKPEHVEQLEKLEKIEDKLKMINDIIENLREEDKKKEQLEKEKQEKINEEWRKKVKEKYIKENEKKEKLEKQKKLSNRWAMHRWVSEFINKHQNQWETEKKERELEICKELENWNKSKRLEKIKLLQKKWNRTNNSKETTDLVESPEFPDDEVFQNLETLLPIIPSENNSNWKCWRKRKLGEPDNKEGFDTTEENLAEEITPTIPYNTSGIVKKPKFLVQTKINTTNTTNLTEIPADNNSRLTSNDVMIRVECPHRHQATNTTQISFLQPSEFISEHPPPISHPDVQKNMFRLIPENEYGTIYDIQVKVECSQCQQAESTTMVSPLQTSTIIPEHPPPTSESEVQKNILRTISEDDITKSIKEDINI